MLNFSCTGCGNCCKSLLSISISESLRFYHQIAFSAVVEVFQLPEDSAEKIVKENENFIVRRINGNAVLFHFYIIGVPGPNGCYQLASDNKCNIYSDRPAVCRTYPLIVAPGNAKHSASSVLKNAITEKENNSDVSLLDRCDGFDESTEPLFNTDGSIMDESVNDIFNTQIEENAISKHWEEAFVDNIFVGMDKSKISNDHKKTDCYTFSIADFLTVIDEMMGGGNFPLEDIKQKQSEIAHSLLEEFEQLLVTPPQYVDTHKMLKESLRKSIDTAIKLN